MRKMQYWYVQKYTRDGDPVWARGRAYGYRRKNKEDQVFVKTMDGFEWIFAQVVATRDDKSKSL